MNWEIQVISGEEIIRFCHTLVAEKVSSSISISNSVQSNSNPIAMALSIDTYISYMFIIAILLGFFYFKRLNIKNK